MWFSFDPAVIVLLAGCGALYLRALRVCRGRGLRVRRWQQASFWTGLALFALALLGPFDGLGERLMSAHMAQHLLIADLGAPLLLAGLRTPVLLFFLPRAALVALARRRRLRRVFALLRRPLVAIFVYVAVLYAWHVGPLFEAAMNSDLVHALQHQSFVAASILVWWPALEPNRRSARGELWKIGHILGARLAGMMLGMAFIVVRVPLYTGAYGADDRYWHISAVADQQTAGGMMLSLDFFVTLFALTFFFWRSAADHDREARSATHDEIGDST